MDYRHSPPNMMRPHGGPGPHGSGYWGPPPQHGDHGDKGHPPPAHYMPPPHHYGAPPQGPPPPQGSYGKNEQDYRYSAPPPGHGYDPNRGPPPPPPMQKGNSEREEELEAVINRLQQDIEVMKNEHSREVNDLRMRLEHTTQNFLAIERQYKSSAEDIANVERERDKREDETRRALKTVKRLEKELARVEEDLTYSEEKNETQKDKMKLYEVTISSLQEQLDKKNSLDDEDTSAKDTIEELTNLLEESKKQMELLQETCKRKIAEAEREKQKQTDTTRGLEDLLKRTLGDKKREQARRKREREKSKAKDDSAEGTPEKNENEDHDEEEEDKASQGSDNSGRSKRRKLSGQS
eukprot:Clim_evm16s12 gene=Clim_evmTU16s12